LRRQAERQRIASRRRHLCEADARVSGSRLDDHLAGTERPAALGVNDHPERRAILDRPTGIHPFDLDPHLRHARVDDAR
jgi:hypothetical protein